MTSDRIFCCKRHNYFLHLYLVTVIEEWLAKHGWPINFFGVKLKAWAHKKFIFLPLLISYVFAIIINPFSRIMNAFSSEKCCLTSMAFDIRLTGTQICCCCKVNNLITCDLKIQAAVSLGSWQICPELNMSNEIQIPYDKHHKVFLLVKTHKNTQNSVKYEVLLKQYLHSILDISRS